jgi:hypothetical protein
VEKLLQFGLYELFGLFLDFVATIVGHHISLVWEVKFFLVADNCPAAFNKDRHAINWDVFLLGVRQKQSVRVLNFKSIAQFFCFIEKLLFFEDLVRHHRKLKLKELLGLRFF